MRRLITRGYKAPVADDCTLPGVNDKPQTLQSREVEGRGISGSTVPVAFDYACLEYAGSYLDGMAFRIEGFNLNTQQYWKAWYTPTGKLAQGWAEFEQRVGPHPEELTKWFMNEVIKEHSARCTAWAGRPERTFCIRDIIPVVRNYECRGCGARFTNRFHGNYYRTCPDHNVVFSILEV